MGKGYDPRVNRCYSTFDDYLHERFKVYASDGFTVSVNTERVVAADPERPEFGNWGHAAADAAVSRRDLGPGRHRERLRHLGLVVDFNLGTDEEPLIRQRWNPSSLYSYFAVQRAAEEERRRRDPTNGGTLKRGQTLPSSGSLLR